ncbi:PH domain-containing protein [Streptomyces roseolus]|uniref:PH domain-containing protein n=2 Tax=Streptomyces roseolus TaxID=67358 RepID=UPI00167517F4|nr:PH domain-containing protein [Streptomyces roseolus]
MAISWAVVAGLGIGMIVAVYRVTEVNGFRMGWQGIPAFLALAGAIGRVANCKVILDEQGLTVVNPFRTHRLPKPAVKDVSVDEGGTLEIHLEGGRVVSAFAFGGSVVDHFMGSSAKAQRRIDVWLKPTRPGMHSEDSGAANVRDALPRITWTRCESADASLALCVVLTISGAIWMALTGN